MSWFVETLRQYPEIALFLSLGIGYWVGSKSFRGFGLGAVTATLLVALIIGQLGIQISPNVKAVFFLLFLFSVGYSVGPQFVRGITKDGVPQAAFAAVVCVLGLVIVFAVAKFAGYDVGSAAGLLAGSQTISASMGLATDAINRLGLPADQTKAFLDLMPTAYAVTYIFGTVGTAIIVAELGPLLLRVDLRKVCKEYEEAHGGKRELGGLADSWRKYELRAFKVAPDGMVVGKTVGEAEAMFPRGSRIYIVRVRRGDLVQNATIGLELQSGDAFAAIGPRHELVELAGHTSKEIDDPELISAPVEGVDVYVTSKEVDGKSLEELGQQSWARGVYVRRIERGPTETQIPVLPDTTLYRSDVITLVGRTQDTTAAAEALGIVDRATDVADVAFIGIAITIGALIGAVVFKVGGVPVTLSTAGGTLIFGIICGWLRGVYPVFGRIPRPTLWFMNSVGLSTFIAVIGLSAGPKFVAGLQHLGFSIFLWGIVATTVPLIVAIFVGKYVFRFHPAILLGACTGARTCTAALGMVNEKAQSQVPALGYTVTYAVGNTLFTIWGMIIVLLVR
jgi:putative transport protein